VLNGAGALKQVKLTYNTLAGGLLTVGDSVTVGAATGIIAVSTPATLTTGTIDVDVSTGTFAAGALTDTTSGATATVAEVIPNLVNVINLVDDPAAPAGSGSLMFQTTVAPVAGTNFYLDYIALGLVASDLEGDLSGDVAAGGTVSFDTGLTVLTFSNAPLNGSTVEWSYEQGQLVQDNGMGALIGDVDANGVNTVDYNLGTVDVTFATAPANGTPITASYVKLAQAVQFTMSGGSDGTAVTRNDISNPTLAAAKEGIYALDLVEEPLNVVVPDFEGSTFVQADIVDFCDARQDRFAIFSFANGTTADEALQYVLVDQAFDTRNAAIYYPNINYINDATGVPVLVPCSGFVAGIYAKTAANKNVGKSPGGIVDGALDADGIIGPEFKVDLADRDRLYQARINPLMTSAATGFVVWGVRTLSKDTRWRYINARLLHNFLMYQLKLNLQWVVFENNGPALWVKVTTALEGFMSSLFRLGYFAGQSKEQAYFIKCDSRNNNQTTVDAGRVIIDVGFSPSKPGEFVTFNLSQPASQVTV
jgi:phage tail sheath protein FI